MHISMKLNWDLKNSWRTVQRGTGPSSWSSQWGNGNSWIHSISFGLAWNHVYSLCPDGFELHAFTSISSLNHHLRGVRSESLTASWAEALAAAQATQSLLASSCSHSSRSVGKRMPELKEWTREENSVFLLESFHTRPHLYTGSVLCVFKKPSSNLS